MKILKQSDPRWSLEKIGESNTTIGKDGCLITCLSMLSDWYGQYESPAWLARSLDFTPDGKLLWKSIRPPMRFVYRYYRRYDHKIKEILLSQDNAVVLQVPFKGLFTTTPHWVVLIGFSRYLGYKIADPYDGKIKWLSKSYKDITGFGEVTRAS